ncbi:hypothetical protein H5410_055400 [Solanum commersonii]|uniref:Reverse transcriptase n=1 Tax=Solanum commersonii TaxID=4109 RepID=A0A9J5WI58_SOLCO|nr:hypothetical protein H5410_055400 [Solanum commersonii]
MLHSFHKFTFIGLLEPFQNSRHINKYRRRLRMPLATSNCNGKIWFFTTRDFTTTVIKNTKQQLTLQLHHQSYIHSLFVTLVYAKCNVDNVMGRYLSIGYMNDKYMGSWRGFQFCVECRRKNRDNPFTLWNDRANNECIFERLDRIISNQEMQGWFNHMKVEHLARIEGATRYKKPFGFLKFWTENVSFIDVYFKALKLNLRGISTLKKSSGNKKLGMIGSRMEIEIQNSSTFLQERDAAEFSLLGNIPEIISEAVNVILCKQPTLKEIRKAIFNLNVISTSGHDGLSCAFYQCCWEIVGTDIFRMVQDYSLKRIVSILKKYEVQSGQKVNKEKNVFYLHQSASSTEKQLVEECIGISKGQFPLKYLSCPITHSRKRKDHYVELIYAKSWTARI